MPPIEFVVDVPALRAAAPAAEEGVAFFSVGYDVTVYPRAPLLVQSTYHDSLSEPLAMAVRGTLRDQPNGRQFTLLLRVAAGKPLRLELQRSLECHAEQSGSLDDLRAWLLARTTSTRKDWLIFAEVRLDSAGRALGAKVLGPAPFHTIAGIDSAVVRFVSFTAPTYDGRAIARVDTVSFGTAFRKP